MVRWRNREERDVEQGYQPKEAGSCCAPGPETPSSGRLRNSGHCPEDGRSEAEAPGPSSRRQNSGTR